MPLHGGGNSLPGVNQQRFDVGLNYNLRDNLRMVSSYGRSFSSTRDANVWNIGFTYRFTLPLWPEKEIDEALTSMHMSSRVVRRRIVSCARVEREWPGAIGKQSKQAPAQAAQPDRGEQVFTTNCVRCHTPPGGMPQRITGTVVMHMRVRARLSREDEQALLRFLAP